MPSNVEIKARLPDRERAISAAEELSGSEGNWLECSVLLSVNGLSFVGM